MSDHKSRQAEDRAKPVTYPYLVVRIFAAFYQRESIQICVGPPTVEITNRRCVLQHPAPFVFEGTMSEDCRALLIQGVQLAVRQLGLRICIVWSDSRCTYVETDSTNEHAAPPSGGALPANLQFKSQHYPPVEPNATSDNIDTVSLENTTSTGAGSPMMPSDVAVTGSLLNDYLERKAEAPNPRIQGKRRVY